jgi:hypothetical protein
MFHFAAKCDAWQAAKPKHTPCTTPHLRPTSSSSLPPPENIQCVHDLESHGSARSPCSGLLTSRPVGERGRGVGVTFFCLFVWFQQRFACGQVALWRQSASGVGSRRHGQHTELQIATVHHAVVPHRAVVGEHGGCNGRWGARGLTKPHTTTTPKNTNLPAPHNPRHPHHAPWSCRRHLLRPSNLRIKGPSVTVGESQGMRVPLIQVRPNVGADVPSLFSGHGVISNLSVAGKMCRFCCDFKLRDSAALFNHVASVSRAVCVRTPRPSSPGARSRGGESQRCSHWHCSPWWWAGLSGRRHSHRRGRRADSDGWQQWQGCARPGRGQGEPRSPWPNPGPRCRWQGRCWWKEWTSW